METESQSFLRLRWGWGKGCLLAGAHARLGRISSCCGTLPLSNGEKTEGDWLQGKRRGRLPWNTVAQLSRACIVPQQCKQPKLSHQKSLGRMIPAGEGLKVFPSLDWEVQKKCSSWKSHSSSISILFRTSKELQAVGSEEQEIGAGCQEAAGF